MTGAPFWYSSGGASASEVAYSRRVPYRVDYRNDSVGKESCVGLLLEDKIRAKNLFDDST